MKLIEAMKTVKMNKEKIVDLHTKISQHSANYSHETLEYGERTKDKVTQWVQSCIDLSQENIRLLLAIQRTNLATSVTIVLNDVQVTKSIAEWVWRRREYAKIDATTYLKLTDRGLKEEATMNQPTGPQVITKLCRQYDPEARDTMLLMYKQEPQMIDTALEITNAITDLDL